MSDSEQFDDVPEMTSHPDDFDDVGHDDSTLCHYCGGDGWGIVGTDWESDDPINGPLDGEIEDCPCCGGSGKAKDCTFW